MMIASTVSLVFAEQMQLQQVIAIARYLETMVVIYVTARLSSRTNTRAWLLSGIICAVWVETIGGLAMYLAYSSEGERGILLGINSFMLMTFAVLLYLGQAASGKPVLVRVLSASLLMIAILLTVTRSAWLFLIVALIVAGVLWGRTIVRLLAGVLGAVGAAVGVVLVVWPSMLQLVVFRFTQFGESGGVIVRLYLWDRAVGAFLAHPLSGIGSGGLARQMEQLPSRFGFRLTGEYAEMEASHRAHNLLLGLLAEMGLVGLAAYFVWVVTVSALCLRTLRHWRSREVDDATSAAAVVILTSLLSDFWAEGSFIAMSSALIGFVLGSLALRRSADGQIRPTTSGRLSGSW
jgi:O-antigen ligase